MNKTVLVIGAVAAGPKAASRFKRLEPDGRVIMIDQGVDISYGGCGIPYYISGEVDSLDALRATVYGVVRDPAYFRDVKAVAARIRTRALAIDRAAHTVLVENLETGTRESLAYDKLVLALGSAAKVPPVEGRDLEGVTTITTLSDAERVRRACASGRVKRAVVVGGGFIGLETAVALTDMWGVETGIVEFADHLMPGVLSPVLADMIAHDLRAASMQVFCGERVQRLEGESGRVARVVTDKRVLEADLVIMATGFAPRTELAEAAGLAVDPKTRGILVNEYLQTSDPDIYAGGDCVAVPHLVTGRPAVFPLGSLANRQGRVIGSNLAGVRATFAGAVGTWAVKLCAVSASGVGLTPARALAEGFDALSVVVEQADRAHFYPEKSMMTLELTVDRTTRRVLGLQGVCADGDALKARIDAFAAMLQFGRPLIEDLSNAETAYAPPFSAALDVLNTAANVADNVVSGRMKALSSREFSELWEKRASGEVYFADARPAAAAEAAAAAHPGEWHALPLEEVREKLATLPRDKPIVLVCNTGLRAYEVMLFLRRHGITDTANVMGGRQSLLKRGETV